MFNRSDDTVQFAPMTLFNLCGQGVQSRSLYSQPMRTSDTQLLFCYTTTKAGAYDTSIICPCSLCFFYLIAHESYAAQPPHKCSKIACGTSFDFARVYTNMSQSAKCVHKESSRLTPNMILYLRKKANPIMY